MSILSDNLKKARHAAGFSSQVKAAAALGIKRSLLGAYEEARCQPPPTLLPAIVRTYRIHDWQGFLLQADWEPAELKPEFIDSDLLLKERDELIERLNHLHTTLKNLAGQC